MHLHLFRSTIIPFIPILFFILVINTPTSLCVDDEYYTNCSKSYKCGEIAISYPFWGGGSDDNRPYYCGYLGFNITCQDDVATITFNTTAYRVLNIEDSTRTLTVARNDYYDGYCPETLFNTTIDISLVNYSTSTSQNLTMYYNCVSNIPTVSLPNQYTCYDNNSVGYYFTSNLDIIESSITRSLGSCGGNVRVPVSESAIETLSNSQTETNLIAALNGGFGLVWDANDTLCSVCTGSDGQCGRNLTTNEFACYCSDQSYPTQCFKTATEKKSVALALGLGIGIGGVAIAGIFLGFLFLYVRQRKKQQVALSKSKDLSTPPSSKGLTTPTTKFSSTTPSYFSSQSTDLEKGGSTYFGVQVFSYTELEEATNNFDSARELGDGGFGIVYYGNLQDGRVVAVKRLYEKNFKRVEQFMNEVEILTRLRHPNLVLLYGCTSRRSRELLLVYEYIPNGTVADHLHGKNAKSGLLTWPIRLSIAIETADALAYLHRSDIIHRDVKTNNILLDNNFQVKVADFGLSRLFPTDCTHVSTAPQGTPGYVDPEYYQCYQLTDKSDVYSFGVVLVELISSMEAVDTNRHRHDINLSNMAVSKIQNQALHELVDPSLGFETDSGVRRMTTVVAELAFRCLQQERDMRPSMVEVLETLKGIEKEEFGESKAEVVDIRSDDVGLLKNVLPPPFSPDSVVADKWVSSSTPPSSF